MSALFDRSHASRWGLTVERFHAAVDASMAHAFRGQSPTDAAVDRYLAALHVEDLALATACAEGIEAAWDHFVREYRPALSRAADAIDSTGGARDLADALYADLYGLKERDGKRQSLFRYFHGRSSLATWLRAVLSQRYIDRVRSGRRFEPLPEDGSAAFTEGRTIAADPERDQYVDAMRHALSAAVAALAARDRLRLGCYYAQEMTLAEIGRMLGEHEATVSRHLTRTRRVVRETVEETLRRDHGLDASSIAECFRSVADDAGPLDLVELIGDGPMRKNIGQDRSR